MNKALPEYPIVITENLDNDFERGRWYTCIDAYTAYFYEDHTYLCVALNDDVETLYLVDNDCYLHETDSLMSRFKKVRI